MAAYETGIWPPRCRVSVVIPALNEAENLPYVLPHIPDGVHEVILIDGHSVDDTISVARQLLPDIRVVQQPGKGKGDALRAGFEAVTGDIIVMLDADGSTDPREIPQYVGALLAGADFAKGSRFLHGGGTADMPRYRQFGNLAFVYFVRLLYGGRFSDLCYGYNAFWTSTTHLLQLNGDGFEIETMMNVRALRAGLQIAEVPSFEAKRVYGEGRLKTIPDGLRVLRTIWHERHTPIPEHSELDDRNRVMGEINALLRSQARRLRRGPEAVRLAQSTSPAFESDLGTG